MGGIETKRRECGRHMTVEVGTGLLALCGRQLRPRRDHYAVAAELRQEGLVTRRLRGEHLFHDRPDGHQARLGVSVVRNRILAVKDERLAAERADALHEELV